ncbi:type VI secretion system tube protein Hcp [Sulfurimonas sp.]|uniref:type VI secretion system tube protein Hcp n=1 Tax=Sulfurimonas sp. TaxID=2022749 RepID=UPI002B45E9AF|nr:type VI secretion system tube protein Hcp [Sulfurimonas sp.]
MGKQEHFYTIALEDAVISSLTASSNGSEPVEYLNFSYRKIVLRHETSSTSSSDDIRTGVPS